MTTWEWAVTQNTVSALWLLQSTGLQKKACCAKLKIWELPTYQSFSFHFCSSLFTRTSFPELQCGLLWRCSSGFDRHRQDWVDSGCPEEVHMFFIMTRFGETSCHIQYRCYNLMKMVSHLVKVDSSYRVPWGFKSLHVFSQFILIPILWGRGCYCPHITRRRRGRGERRWWGGM